MPPPCSRFPTSRRGATAGGWPTLESRPSARGVTLLDRHSDADHDRTVFTLAGRPGPLTEALVAGAEEALETIDMDAYRGAHPAIGALDVCPLVWLDPADREAARTEAVAVAEQIGGLGVPVFLYGELAREPEPGRARLLPQRRPAGALAADGGGGAARRTSGRRCRTGAAAPPWSPRGRRSPPSTSSSTAATSRSPARSPPALREAGGGLRGVRAIGLLLSSGRAQVSTNVHDPLAVPLGEVVERVRELAAPLGARPLEAELVGLIPRRGPRRLPRGRADPRLRPRAARDRAAARGARRPRPPSRS